jgi:glycine/D-amino acid oxidase-like deaminating enzyme
MSQCTLDVIEAWQTWGTIEGTPPPELNWRGNGYLFIVRAEDVDTLASNFETHQKCGVEAEWLEQADLAERYPGLVSDDLVAGILSRRDGWLDPKVFFSVLRAKAEAAGVTSSPIASPASTRPVPSSAPSVSPPVAPSPWTRWSTPPASTPPTWLPSSG